MWTEQDYAELDVTRTKVIHVRSAQLAGQICVGSASWCGAPEELVKLCQAIINRVDDHRHLQEARILLLIRTAAADEKKLQEGKRVTIGKATKANAAMKLLSRFEKKLVQPVDFVIWLNGIWLERIGAIEFDGDGGISFIAEEEAFRKTAALLDHEMSHCGAKIVGQFVGEAELDGFVQDLGTRYIETRNTITDERGRVLVRFYKTPAAGSGFEFCMRKHDIEEFTAVAGRHGPWIQDLKDLVDELKESEETLFSGAS